MYIKWLIILLTLPILLSAQTTYYVAHPDSSYAGMNTASDANDGSFLNPWATWQKGVNEATPGDTVYIRGGTYFRTTRLQTFIAGAMVIDPDVGYGMSGKRDSVIHYWNYPGETPILDCSQMDNGTSNYNHGIKINYAEYIHLKGLTVRSVLQNKNGSAPEAYGISGSRIRNLTFENVTVHDIGGRGFWLQGGAFLSWQEDGGTTATPYFTDNSIDTTRFINCDVYDLCDTIDYTGGNTPGNSADAWKTIHYRGNYVLWEGCRAWNYTDDATDPSAINGAHLRINNFWAMPGGAFNGINIPSHITGADTTYGVEQNGIKLSKIETDIDDHVGIVTNCIAMFGETGGGFTIIDRNPYRGNHVFYNNTSYYFRWCFNGTGVSTLEYPRTEIFRNNLAWGATSLNAIGQPAYVSLGTTGGEPATLYPESHNNWDAYPGAIGFTLTDTVTVTSDDFLYGLDSVTMVQMFVADRNADGSLPPNPLALDPSSDLIDAGTQVFEADNLDFTLSFEGAAPDIGAGDISLVYSKATPPASIRRPKPGRSAGGTSVLNGKVLIF